MNDDLPETEFYQALADLEEELPEDLMTQAMIGYLVSIYRPGTIADHVDGIDHAIEWLLSQSNAYLMQGSDAVSVVRRLIDESIDGESNEKEIQTG